MRPDIHRLLLQIPVISQHRLEGKGGLFTHNNATLIEAAAHGFKTVPPELRATSMVLPGIVAAAIGFVRN